MAAVPDSLPTSPPQSSSPPRRRYNRRRTDRRRHGPDVQARRAVIRTPMQSRSTRRYARLLRTIFRLWLFCIVAWFFGSIWLFNPRGQSSATPGVLPLLVWLCGWGVFLLPPAWLLLLIPTYRSEAKHLRRETVLICPRCEYDLRRTRVRTDAPFDPGTGARIDVRRCPECGWEGSVTPRRPATPASRPLRVGVGR